MMAAMDIACTADATRAPERGGERARRIGQVKFVALVLDEPPAVPEPEPLSPSCPGLLRAWRAFLSRVMGRLAAARP